MRSPPRPLVNALAWLCLASVPSVPMRARAQAPAQGDVVDDIDDPKVARRLGTRLDLPPPAPGADAAVAPGEAPALTSVPAAPWGGDTPAETSGALDAGPSPAAQETAPRTAHLVLAYRRFTFAQVGATSMSGPGVDEPFDVLSLDLYPVSSSWRFGLSTQYGWEEGTFRQGGDAFIAESASLGGQIPGPVFTPFFEVYGGGGYMQRTHARLNAVATAYGQVGVDVGTQIFLAKHFCFSAAIGFLRATNGFAKANAFGSFSVDALSFKLGVGL